ncbi:hypothetical protein AgCh_013833 [Apium graveolens]
MERFYKRLKPSDNDSEIEVVMEANISNKPEATIPLIEVNVSDTEVDPGLRKPINEISPNEKDRIRRAYLLRGPFQPVSHVFPFTLFGKKKRRFRVSWFKDYANWLEYSIKKDVAFCLYCYLFKDECGARGNNETFVNKGYRNWKKPERLGDHIGKHNSIHSQCQKACEELMNRKQHVDIAIVNQGNFLVVLKFLTSHSPDIKDVFNNSPENNKLTAPAIQKDITNACTIVTANAISLELGDRVFSILVDEARDISNKEQMAVVLRFVDKRGCVVEMFVGIVHVTNTTAVSLKAAIESLLATYGLSITRIRGQGYDGASNMRGEFNGLKSLLLAENKSAHFVHCFAHQLQLTLVVVAKNHKKLGSFFNCIANLTNIVGGSCKRRDILRENRLAKVVEQLNSGELTTGRGLNQEISLKRAADTRWGSHYGVIVNLISMYPFVVNLLEYVENYGTLSDQRSDANDLLDVVQCFEFGFLLHLMKNVLGITNELSQALQRKDQDLLNAMDLVKAAKNRFQNLRENGLECLLEETYEFCNKNLITIPRIEEAFVPRGRSRRGAE